MDRKEYLLRPLIEGVKFTISDERVRIENDCTTYIDITKRWRTVTLPEVEGLFRQLKASMKGHGSKVKLKGSTKFLKTVRELFPAYNAAVLRMEELFPKLVEASRQLEADGLHMGTRDDELLESVSQMESEIKKNYYGNSDYSRLMNIHNTVEKALQEKAWERSDLYSFTIHLC